MSIQKRFLLPVALIGGLGVVIAGVLIALLFSHDGYSKLYQSNQRLLEFYWNKEGETLRAVAGSVKNNPAFIRALKTDDREGIYRSLLPLWEEFQKGNRLSRPRSGSIWRSRKPGEWTPV